MDLMAGKRKADCTPEEWERELERKRRWSEANRGKVKEHSRKYYYANREAYQEAGRLYQKANREAINERRRRWREANREAINERRRRQRQARREKINEQKRLHYEANREEINKRKRQYRETNRDKVREQQRRCYEANREAINERNRRRYQNDVNFKLADLHRRRFLHALAGQLKEESAMDLLGCTADDARRWLEAHFRPGMSWDNWALDGWHVDHVRPIASFDLKDPEQRRRAFHFSNTQPLWAEENRRKGARHEVG